ncbi:alpha-L-rhamnosidase C-terminal domain-containing protein [Phnomibacter ginsenosidimutans]|uniref:Bacterial alpha-L-rhamnosidase n=1 Tax=Phnomibacter ginsenosidimutans TaxID=2676868 RepID=A0A6I6GMC7_9BACT|nr:alpha-L-rhamnosidase C-terminal domain-containing protein [Phnomibacter ginsenosidimutans]QGW28838.1 Bacterial alpha-L-rhamnosidase [Phnomibacter ginsenosidimutans]
MNNSDLSNTISTPTWIWYPGDFEIVLANKMQNRRTERGTFFPVFWKIDSHYVLMDFHKVFDVPAPETVDIYVEGEYHVKLDGKAFEGSPKQIVVPAGKHKINIKVFNQANVPAIYVKGKTIVSDASWLVTFEDKEWIDETGKASDISATKWLNAGSWNFNSPTQLPSQFALPVREQKAISTVKGENSMLVDFGKETFGFIQLNGLSGKGKLSVYYGESEEEALSTEHCETLDRVDVNNTEKKDEIMKLSKAYRFVNVQYDEGVILDSVSMLYEYADVKERGSFTCNDEEINRIYDVSKYTFELNTREFFIDGIKRDRWMRSGDAYQSYLMNYYLYFDNETVKRTTYALRGKDPVTGHINTIMDYTFYWFLGIYDYYLYTGDKKFIAQNYDRMKALMDYVLARRNKEGLMEWMTGDWIFIDWAEGLSKKGEVSFEQLLLARSLETMALCANIADDKDAEAQYNSLAADMRNKLFSIYWNDTKQALVHSRVDGQQTENVTRYANMFSIFFDYFNEEQKQQVKTSVLLNDDIQKITTPYMRFYELEALCALGEQNYVLSEMKDYWGGMLKLGATSFWEEYNPAKQGAEHYAMYGRKFGKSLCHAWGASPLYLLGKYYLGVKPTAPGYQKYVVEPNLGGLEWMQGKVPTPQGEIELKVTNTTVEVKAPAGMGLLRLKSSILPEGRDIVPLSKGNGLYEMAIQPGIAYIIQYKAD